MSVTSFIIPICEWGGCLSPGNAYDCIPQGTLVVQRRHWCTTHVAFAQPYFSTMSPVPSLLSSSGITNYSLTIGGSAAVASHQPSHPVPPTGTLCSVIGCMQVAVAEVEGLLHRGNRHFVDFKGALCQQCLDEDFVVAPKKWTESLAQQRKGWI